MIARLLHSIVTDSVWTTDPSRSEGLPILPKLTLLRICWWVAMAYMGYGMLVGDAKGFVAGFILILLAELFALAARITAIHATTLILLQRQAWMAHQMALAATDESDNAAHEG